MPMLDMNEVRADAINKLHEERHKKAVEQHLKHLKAKKAHLFSKRIKFQWPIKLEHWYNPERL